MRQLTRSFRIKRPNWPEWLSHQQRDMRRTGVAPLSPLDAAADHDGPRREAQQARLRRELGRPAPWVGYGTGVLITILAVVARYVLDSRLPQTPTPLLFAAVTLSPRYGGLGPGLLSTLLSALGLEVVLEDQIGIRSAGGPSILHLCAFVLVALLVSTLNDRARRAEAQARADATRLRILADASRAFAAAVPGHLDTMQTVARQLVDALGDACVINQLSEDGRWLDHVAWHHRNPAAQTLMTRVYTGQRQAADQGVSGQALLSGRPVMMNTR